MSAYGRRLFDTDDNVFKRRAGKNRRIGHTDKQAFIWKHYAGMHKHTMGQDRRRVSRQNLAELHQKATVLKRIEQVIERQAWVRSATT